MTEKVSDTRWESKAYAADEIVLEDVRYTETKYLHRDGMEYMATEFPFESEHSDFSSLEKSLHLNSDRNYPMVTIAATVARIANTRMDESKKDNQHSTKLPHSPTYQIKDGDFVWFAYCEIDEKGKEHWKKYEHPFKIQIGRQGSFNKSINSVAQGGYSQIGDILNGHVGNNLSVRIYRHADLSQEYAEKTIEPIIEPSSIVDTEAPTNAALEPLQSLDKDVDTAFERLSNGDSVEEAPDADYAPCNSKKGAITRITNIIPNPNLIPKKKEEETRETIILTRDDESPFVDIE